MAVTNFHARNAEKRRELRRDAHTWLVIVVVFAILFAIFMAAPEPAAGNDKVTICHAAGLDGTTQYVTITVAYPAAFGQAGHFYEDGTPQAGHEDDYLGACNVPVSTTTSPSTTIPPTVPPTVPPATVPPTSPPECDWSVIDDTGAEGCLVTTTTTVTPPPVVPVMPPPAPVPFAPEFTG